MDCEEIQGLLNSNTIMTFEPVGIKEHIMQIGFFHKFIAYLFDIQEVE